MEPQIVCSLCLNNSNITSSDHRQVLNNHPKPKMTHFSMVKNELVSTSKNIPFKILYFSTNKFFFFLSITMSISICFRLCFTIFHWNAGVSISTTHLWFRKWVRHVIKERSQILLTILHHQKNTFFWKQQHAQNKEKLETEGIMIFYKWKKN